MTLHILCPVFYGKPSGKCCEVKGQNHLSGMIPFTRWYLLAILGDDPRDQIEEELKRTVRTSMALQPFPSPAAPRSDSGGKLHVWGGMWDRERGLWKEVCEMYSQVGRKSKLWLYGNRALPLKGLTWEYLPQLSHTHRETRSPQWQKMGWGTMYTTPAKQNTAQFSLQNTSWKTKKEEKNETHIRNIIYSPYFFLFDDSK